MIRKKILDTITLPSGSGYVDTELIRHQTFLQCDGNAVLSVSIAEASKTISVKCRLKIGDNLYSPWFEFMDESDPKINTFTSAANFFGILYNQSWFTPNHLGFELRFTRDSGSGDSTITYEGIVT